jgi:hypothetical protein
MLHDVVRRYLKRRHNIAGRCRTTDELLQRAKTADIPEDRQALLERFLLRCDPARFSGRELGLEECQEMLALARQITT